MRKIISYAAIAMVTVLLGRLLFIMIPGSGQFITFETINVEQCKRVEVAPGSEDIQIDHDTGIAYIAATDRRDKTPNRHVGIYVLNLHEPNATAVRLEGELPKDFTPHGISLWRSPSGELRLFVVNHPRGKHSIEIFSLDESNYLTHLETITSDKLTSPNDIVATGERQFYVSNMQRASGGISLTLERYLGLPVTDVVYFDGISAKPAASGLITANGVNMSFDGTELYVAEVIPQRINIFKRNPTTGELSERKRISIGTGADNIDLAPDGSLYIGSHPNLLAFTKHAANTEENSPSHVVQLDPVSGKYETVFMSVNGEINGSSIGAYWKGNLLVGSVYENHVMRCKQPNSGV